MKKRVHYSLMEDMKKYIKGFKPKDYQKDGDYTDPEVIEYVRKYYAMNLPVDVTAWMKVNKPDSNLLYGYGLGMQLCFVRDVINPLLRPSYKEQEKNLPLVISTHRSKSVVLPVYQIKLEKYGIEIILRNNFYDWKVSIKSVKPLNYDFMGLFDPKEEVNDACCEGFPKEKIYGSFEKNPSQFTIALDSNYELYTFFYLLKHYLGIKA